MRTTVQVLYPLPRGDIALRGDVAPLDWDTSLQATGFEDGTHIFEFDLEEGELLEFKPIRRETDWATQRNQTVMAGEHLTIMPVFDHTAGELLAGQRVHSAVLKRDMTQHIYLPPSYREHKDRRYPVLYALDGQSLFDADGWDLHSTVDQLIQMGALDDAIIVGMDTEEDRLNLLSPQVDPIHGGGNAHSMLAFLVDELKPWVDENFRTKKSRPHTGILGSSLGGLFSFYAAWTRPDIFGRMASLSGAFWWADRHMVTVVQRGYCPVPRPWLYLDSGAALDPFEQDANLKDGFHHVNALTKALTSYCYKSGVDIHTLTFPGQGHSAAAWGQRLSIPLQLIFPPMGR